MLPTTNYWRNIVETSIMNNNDEYVFYTKCEVTAGETDFVRFGFKNPGPFSERKLVLSRPVFELEIENGLQIILMYPASVFDYKSPEASLLIDAIYRLANIKRNYWDRLDALCEENGKAKLSISKHIASYVGDSLYDCMSGGMPIYEISIIKCILDNVPDIDWDAYVYPKLADDKEGDLKKDYYTLSDFYEQHAKKAPDLSRSGTELLGLTQHLLLKASQDLKGR